MRILSMNHALAMSSYIALLILQLVWHALLPSPYGAGLWWLALLAALPLIFPLKGICQGSLRSMTWGGYILMLYFAIGVMESWSNPMQRIPALIQTTLVVICFLAIFRFSRESQ